MTWWQRIKIQTKFEKTVPTKLIMEGMSDTININFIT